ncbi:MAG: PQQ-binding-like beta-propeller repeat protein [Pirellulales bacterium]|nr:PQQ-binding-like beta-propeller repeat protein [Pirellulales bacterium]
MLNRAILATSVGLAIWTSSVSADMPDGRKATLERIDRLLASGAADEALGEVRRLQNTLPSTKRLTAWELDFRGEVFALAHGRECLYYLLSRPRPGSDAPGYQGALPSVSANFEHSDWESLVVCVGLKIGRIRWSRAVNGLVHLAVDPRTDVLYLYRERLVAIDPDSGDVLDRQDPPEPRSTMEGLVLGRGLVVLRENSSRPTLRDGRASLYDPERRLTREMSIGDYWWLAPDESKRLVPVGEGWDCVGVPDGQKRWSFPGLFLNPARLQWCGGQPTFITGTCTQRGVVTSIDLATGTPRWSTVLGWGAYEAGHHYLRGNRTPDDWDPLTMLDEHLLAVDNSARLYFLKPETGQTVAAPRLTHHLLAAPFQYEGQLIVSSFGWIRSYAIADLLRPESSLDAALRIREARCLSALGRHKEALGVVDLLVERAPQLAAAWSQRAATREAMNDPAEQAEETFSRCRAMSLSGRVTDDTLRGRVGLLRLYDLQGKPCWLPKEDSDFLYVGTLAGDLWRVNTRSLDFERVARVDHEIEWLKRNTTLKAALGDSVHSRRPVPKTPARSDARIPPHWYTLGGEQRISEAVSYRGRQFRSMRGGAVRVLSGTEVTDLAPRLDVVGEWTIHVSPAGPLGYGDGVFELDEDMRPIRWLIRPTVGGKPAKVSLLQQTPQSIGIVACGKEGAALQTYTRQGVLLNEVALDDSLSAWVRPAQLLPMADGYLFSDHQLTWISADTDRRFWRFGPSPAQTWFDRRERRWRDFGDPLLVRGCLYVTGFDGHLYVFDPAQIVATSFSTNSKVLRPGRR